MKRARINALAAPVAKRKEKDFIRRARRAYFNTTHNALNSLVRALAHRLNRAVENLA